ncbi:MAG: bi-domain-containing oxidoreductase [Roseiarcus sp.]|jgi:predicted dehydrogenase/threonine dehydrogenase-like Zn-dependent dehydrogenase
MRQILFASTRALVARMPEPGVEPGAVLVRARFSLISAGTELAALRPLGSGADGATAAERVGDITVTARLYLGKAIRNPRLAARRALRIATSLARQSLADAAPLREPAPAPRAPIRWLPQAARECTGEGGALTLVSAGEPGHYQAESPPIPVSTGCLIEVRLKGRILAGGFALGLLNDDKSTWLGMIPLSSGPLDESVHLDPGQAREVTLVLTNPATPGENRMTLERSEFALVPAMSAGAPVTDMTDQGWNVGYSLAGEVVGVGAGVTDFVVGDLVACAGAGQANHADYVSVRRNLVCRVPAGCAMREAATATVGAIAMQGVRRAAPQIGEIVCVIGLGLIGMIVVQLLRASGCRVIGVDLDAERCRRALGFGAAAAETDVDRALIRLRDLTAGHGVDATIVTAASKSSTPINSAMELTRRRGRVVIIGDVGLKVERAAFYRKEIDLLMSTSYGPGRYDGDYEDLGRDYPYGFVRWTANRNMQAYLELIAEKRLDIAALIDRVIRVDEAPAAYAQLARPRGTPPLAVVIAYPEPVGALVDLPDARLIQLRGHRRPIAERVNYALVGAGGFGTQMLVPMMERRKDRFFLRGVVSRDAARGGNFARSKQVELLASSYEAVVRDDRFDLMVIATRHAEHAHQVTSALEAGKHVFVEKPLAISWEQLDAVRASLAGIADPPRLTVGFNRRFAPAIQRLKDELGGQRTPIMINYRLNAGYIPLDHWVQGPEGGGRNIGEACHMYDLFAFLAGAPVVSVGAAAIDPGARAYARSDNFCATIGYADGSLGQLTYTALGPKTGLAKERIEVFGNGEAWIVDDFKSLTRASDGAVLWSAAAADKGHAEEMSRFADALAGGGPDPIPLDQIFETTAVALHVEDLLHGRSGEALE